MMSTDLIWNDAELSMPLRNKYVAVETSFCIYPFCCAKFNGIDWINDQKEKIENVKFWAYVQTPAKAGSDG